MDRNWNTNWRKSIIVMSGGFDPEKEGRHLASALDYFQYQLKGISFLPKMELGAYKQMPYEEITEKEYNKMFDKLSYLSFRQVKGAEAEVEKFCNNDTWEIDFEQIKETQDSKVPSFEEGV